MKLYKNLIYVLLLSAGLTATSCVGDLDVTPIDPSTNTSDKALNSAADFKAFLAQCYTGFATSGSYGPDGDSNISGMDGGQSQYFRGLFHLNEYTTDECVVGWNDQTIQDLHGLAWTTSDTFIFALYSRIFYQVSMCNEFIRQANASSLDFPEKAAYIAEARALRALAYYHAIDMFGNVPFADETSSVSSVAPQRITRSELFTWLETELKDLIGANSALAEARQNEYGRIDKGGASMILAKLYLNAEVYIGTAKYNECAQICKEIQGKGYSLHPKYEELFMADNNETSTDEIIFAVEQDGINTQSYGVTNFIIFASVGGKMDTAAMGISSGWGGIRVTPEFYDSFVTGDQRAMFFTTEQQKEIDDIANFQHGYAFTKFKNVRGINTQSYGVTNFIIFASVGGKMDTAAMGISSGWGGIRVTPEFYDSFVTGDQRAMFFTTEQQKEIDDIANFQHGYAFTKFKNVRSDGKATSNVGFVDTDFPVFRYADVLLMLSECAVRGASTVTVSEGAAALSLVRERAGLSAVSAYTLDDILRERGCELYLECWRRSDLVRFGKFTSDSYVWSWKGGIKAGKGVDSRYNLFPIPERDLNANPNLIQNEGY